MRHLCLAALAVAFLIHQPAYAVITAPIHLKQVLKQTGFIFTAKVKSLDVEKRLVVFEIDEQLKGKLPFAKLATAFPEDPKRENNQPSRLVKRLAVGMPVVFFADQGVSPVFGKVRDEGTVLFSYSDGTWVQWGGNAKVDGTTMPVRFHHFEPFLRRTFKGTTPELRQVIVDGLSGKREPPAYDPNEPEGLGPEIKR